MSTDSPENQLALADPGAPSPEQFQKLVDVISRSQHNYRELIDNLDQAVFTVSLEGEVRVANRRLAEILQVPFSRLIGHRLSEFVETPVLAEVKQALPQFMSSGFWSGPVLVRLKRDGKLRYFDCWLQALSEGGKVVCVTGWARDVTERREVERQLRQEQEFVRRLVANFPDLICVLDRQGRFTYVGPSVGEILGGAAGEYVGHGFAPRSHPDDHAKLDDILRRLLSGESASAQFEFRVRHDDGRWKTLRASAGPFLDERGKIAGVVASARDVTEAKLIEQELIQKEKFAAMGQMMAGAAHELNNPLTAILGVGELLRERSADDATTRHLDLVMQQARRAAGIVQNLLAFARPAAQAHSEVRLEAIVQQALQFAQPSLSQKNISVKFEAPGNLPAVVGDAKLLVQVFLNVIANAEQAISSVRDHGSLEIVLAAADGRVTATIVDDGPGIPAASVGKLFDPFFTTKRPGGGTGLGLTISLAILKEHGGTIDVKSPAGGGAAFQVILPVAGKSHPVAAHPASPARPLAAHSESPRGHRILIVDDEEGIREIVQEGLAARGMKVDAAESAETALSLLAGNTYDIILCDFNLPRLSGEQLLEQVRKARGESAPRFVFITGELVDASRLAEFSEKGAVILQKPFRIPELAKLLAGLLESETHKAT